MPAKSPPVAADASVAAKSPSPLLGTWLAVAGAALSGLLYWASFAGIDVWPFALIAFGPLWISLQGQSPKRAFLLGTLAGRR